MRTMRRWKNYLAEDNQNNKINSLVAEVVKYGGAHEAPNSSSHDVVTSSSVGGIVETAAECGFVKLDIDCEKYDQAEQVETLVDDSIIWIWIYLMVKKQKLST